MTLVPWTILTTALALAAAGPDDGAAARVLDLADSRTPTAIAQVRAECEKLRRAHPDDPRIDYLAALAFIHQRQFARALPLLERYLSRRPDDALARRTKIWVELHGRGHDRALADCLALSRLFPPNAKDGDDTWNQSAQFLGTVFAYWELARPEATSEQARSAAKDRVLAALGGAYQSVFDDARRLVVEQLAEIEAEQRQFQEQAAARLERRQSQVEATIDDDQQRIAISEETIQTSGEQVREARRKLAVIQTQLASLATDRTRLSAQIAAVQAQINALQQSAMNDRQTNRVSPQLRPEVAAQMTNLALSLAALNRQAFEMDRRILSLQTEARQFSAQNEEGSQALAHSDKTIRGAERRSAALERQARRLATRQPTASGALAARMRAVSTYLTFPYEEEKQRVLGWFEE